MARQPLARWVRFSYSRSAVNLRQLLSTGVNAGLQSPLETFRKLPGGRGFVFHIHPAR